MMWTIKIKVNGVYQTAIQGERDFIEFIWSKIEPIGIYKMYDSQNIVMKRK